MWLTTRTTKDGKSEAHLLSQQATSPDCKQLNLFGKTIFASRNSSRWTASASHSSCIALGRRYTTTKSIIRWTAAALDKSGSGNTATSRDVRRTSGC